MRVWGASNANEVAFAVHSLESLQYSSELGSVQSHWAVDVALSHYWWTSIPPNALQSQLEPSHWTFLGLEGQLPSEPNHG